MQKKIISAVVIEESDLLNFEQFTHALYCDNKTVIEMIEHQLIHPSGGKPTSWKFDSECLRRAKIALRFHHDLEINFPGICLALDLLDQIDQLEKQLKLYK